MLYEHRGEPTETGISEAQKSLIKLIHQSSIQSL